MPANTNTDLRNGVNGDVGCKYPCQVATTANIDLEGTQTIDGVAVVENDIVLVKDQTDATENGVYVVSTGQWERGVWFNNQLNAAPGSLIVVSGGTANAGTIWETICSDDPIEFGTSDITFQLKVKGSNTGDKSVSLTGPVTGSSTESSPGVLTIATTITNDAITTAKINNNAVTNAKLAQVATATFKGRVTASTGNVEDLTTTQATGLLDVMVGDSGSGGTKGLVPAPITGDATKFLKGDGTWGSPSAVPDATTSVKGIAALATQAEFNAGTENTKIVTSALVAGGQTFRAHRGTSDQGTISTGVATKIQFNIEDWDVGNYYDNATNYRFLPTEPGKFLITAGLELTSSSNFDQITLSIYKNGSLYSQFFDPNNVTTGGTLRNISWSDTVDLNGSTDYIEMFASTSSGGTILFKSSNSTFLGITKLR